MNYYERHMGDYAKDAAHLSLLEHGIYCRLLDVYYIHEATIPDSQAARLIGARSQEEISSLINVLSEFFTLGSDGRWRQERCEKEIARYKEKSAKASASASKRWSDRRPNGVPSESSGNAKAMRTHSEGNANGMLPNPQSPITINTPPTPPHGGGDVDNFQPEQPEQPEQPKQPRRKRDVDPPITVAENPQYVETKARLKQEEERPYVPPPPEVSAFRKTLPR